MKWQSNSSATATVDEERTRRQSDEVRILAGMAHHALVTLFDAGTDLSDPTRRLSYLVMELVRGPDLRRRSAEGPLSAAHMALIGHDLADGLAHIHHHGIIHRDVKPANILLVDYSVEDRRAARQTQRLRRGHHHPRRPPRRPRRQLRHPGLPQPRTGRRRTGRPRQRRLFAGAGPAGRPDRENGLPRRAGPVRPGPAAPRPGHPRRTRAHVGGPADLHAGQGSGGPPAGPGSVPGPAPGSHQRRRTPPPGRGSAADRRRRAHAGGRAVPDPGHSRGRRLRPDRGAGRTHVLGARGDCQRCGP